MSSFNEAYFGSRHFFLGLYSAGSRGKRQPSPTRNPCASSPIPISGSPATRNNRIQNSKVDRDVLAVSLQSIQVPAVSVEDRDDG